MSMHYMNNIYLLSLSTPDYSDLMIIDTVHSKLFRGKIYITR
jgi:hypothetical protein